MEENYKFSTKMHPKSTQEQRQEFVGVAIWCTYYTDHHTRRQKTPSFSIQEISLACARHTVGPEVVEPRSTLIQTKVTQN